MMKEAIVFLQKKLNENISLLEQRKEQLKAISTQGLNKNLSEGVRGHFLQKKINKVIQNSQEIQQIESEVKIGFQKLQEIFNSLENPSLESSQFMPSINKLYSDIGVRINRILLLTEQTSQEQQVILREETDFDIINSSTNELTLSYQKAFFKNTVVKKNVGKYIKIFIDYNDNRINQDLQNDLTDIQIENKSVIYKMQALAIIKMMESFFIKIEKIPNDESKLKTFNEYMYIFFSKALQNMEFIRKTDSIYEKKYFMEIWKEIFTNFSYRGKKYDSFLKEINIYLGNNLEPVKKEPRKSSKKDSEAIEKPLEGLVSLLEPIKEEVIIQINTFIQNNTLIVNFNEEMLQKYNEIITNLIEKIKQLEATEIQKYGVISLPDVSREKELYVTLDQITHAIEDKREYDINTSPLIQKLSFQVNLISKDPITYLPKEILGNMDIHHLRENIEAIFKSFYNKELGEYDGKQFTLIVITLRNFAINFYSRFDKNNKILDVTKTPDVLYLQPYLKQIIGLALKGTSINIDATLKNIDEYYFK